VSQVRHVTKHTTVYFLFFIFYFYFFPPNIGLYVLSPGALVNIGLCVMESEQRYLFVGVSFDGI